MLSVAKLTPGQESYYERSVAAGLDDYYAGRGESPGIWTGRGAAILGLEGVVQDRQLGTLIRGVHPLTQERLRGSLPETSALILPRARKIGRIVLNAFPSTIPNTSTKEMARPVISALMRIRITSARMRCAICRTT